MTLWLKLKANMLSFNATTKIQNDLLYICRATIFSFSHNNANKMILWRSYILCFCNVSLHKIEMNDRNTQPAAKQVKSIAAKTTDEYSDKNNLEPRKQINGKCRNIDDD